MKKETPCVSGSSPGTPEQGGKAPRSQRPLAQRGDTSPVQRAQLTVSPDEKISFGGS
jgi:hypothetical protein